MDDLPLSKSECSILPIARRLSDRGFRVPALSLAALLSDLTEGAAFALCGPMHLEHVITVPLLSAITHQPRRKAAVFLVQAQKTIIPIEHHVPSPAVLVLSGRGKL